MKITVSRNVLTAAFTTVAAVVPSRGPKPVLQNARVEWVNGVATLIGTDQEISIRHELTGADAPKAGDILLPAAKTLAILQELRGETVSIEATDSEVWIVADRSEYRLGLQKPEEFPNVPAFSETAFHVVPAGLLKQLIKRTAFACDSESTRYALGGVLVDFKGDRVAFVATDTRRLAVAQGAFTVQGLPKDPNTATVVPHKAMKVLERCLTSDDEPVSVAIQANSIQFRTAHCMISSRLVEGRYPQWQAVIPKEHRYTADLVGGPLLAAVRQSQIVTTEESHGVDFVFSSGNLVLKSQSADVGTSKIELPINFGGPELTATYDPRYVAEFLKVLEPEKLLKLELNDGDGAAVFRTEDGYIYIIMPLSKDR